MIDILLYSHHLPAWYCIDIVRRNSVLVTYGSERVKKVFVEVSVTVMVILLSFEWSVDWTDRFILKGGIGIFYTFLRSVIVLKNLGFRIGWSLLFADFPFFSIWFSVFVKNTCLMGYGFGFRWSFRIVPFGFRFIFDPSGHYAPTVISNSRETSVYSTCQHRIGSIRVLRTGMCTFIGFDCFACGFRFWSSFFFCGFAVLQLWMIFSTALRFPMDPLILPYSGVPRGFLLCKLKISLSKITDLPFRSVPCLKLE